MAQRPEGVRPLTVEDSIDIVDVPPEKRPELDQILRESFDGWYLMHARKTIREIEAVRAAMSSGAPVGLIMLKSIEPGIGYIFYVAVARAHRGTGVARLLLNDALALYRSKGVTEVFASVEKDNLPSEKLFGAEGFDRTNLIEVSKRHGTLRAVNMYRMMVVVPGEILLHRSLG